MQAIPKDYPLLFLFYRHHRRTYPIHLRGLRWGGGALVVAFFDFTTHHGRGRASRSHAVGEAENLGSSYKRAPPSPPRVPQAQSAQSKGDTISHLMPFLMSLQKTQWQILQLIANQTNRVSTPTLPIVVPTSGQPT